MKPLKKIESEIENRIKEKPLSTAIWSIIIIVGICIILTIIIFIPNVYNFENLSDISKTGPLGDTFNGLLGPFIAILVAILTFLAFYIQYKANEIQNDTNRKQDENNQILQFENRFFELIRLHRENVSELSYSKFQNRVIETSENRKVFKDIFREFIDCYRECTKYLSSCNIDQLILNDHMAQLKLIKEKFNLGADLSKLAVIDITYSIVFFGLGEEGEYMLRGRLVKKYDSAIVYRILAYIKLKPKHGSKNRFLAWNNISSLNRKQLHNAVEEIYLYRRSSEDVQPDQLDNNIRILLNGSYTKYYGGHQHRLGHYFRHLYQSYRFLDGSNFLTANQKYSYGKMFRAQLSTYEQALLLVNGVSSLGMKWEYKFEPEKGVEVEEGMSLNSKGLVSRYQLIKNLPGNHFYGITYRDYYPDIKYEGD